MSAVIGMLYPSDDSLNAIMVAALCFILIWMGALYYVLYRRVALLKQLGFIVATLPLVGVVFYVV